MSEARLTYRVEPAEEPGEYVTKYTVTNRAGRVVLVTFDREEAWSEAADFPEIWEEEDES
jgi:hypothetical protein